MPNSRLQAEKGFASDREAQAAAFDAAKEAEAVAEEAAVRQLHHRVGSFSRGSQRYVTPHAPCDVLSF